MNYYMENFNVAEDVSMFYFFIHTKQSFYIAHIAKET